MGDDLADHDQAFPRLAVNYCGAIMPVLAVGSCLAMGGLIHFDAIELRQ